MITATFALLFLVVISSSVILLSDEEVSAVDAEEDGINYTLNSPSAGKATVIAIAGGYSGEIVIPSTII